jgi:hypothetical protein
MAMGREMKHMKHRHKHAVGGSLTLLTAFLPAVLFSTSLQAAML